jgi:hypothetical protein
MRMTVSVDISGALRKLSELQRSGIPKAVSAALTDTTREIEREVVSTMRAKLDRPRPFTERGLYVRPASPTRLESVVGFKPLQAKYLRALIEGGARGTKPAEQKLAGRYFVPGPGVALDRHGNVPRAALAKILQAARSGGKYRGGSLIVGVPRGTNLQAGVWLKTARKLRALLLFVDAPPTYEKRIPFYEIAERTARRTFARNLDVRIARELARLR